MGVLDLVMKQEILFVCYSYYMKLTKRKVIFASLVVAAVIASPFLGRYVLDSREPPEQQLHKLELLTNKEAAIIMAGHDYSISPVAAYNRCINQGPSAFFAFGRDTVSCSYTININSKVSGKELRKLATSAGWYHLKVYDDGSGTSYRKRGLPLCSLSDNKAYHSRKEFETTYVDGLLVLNCQSFTEHYNSPLPPPIDSFD